MLILRNGDRNTECNLTLNMLNFLNGIIHHQVKVGQPTV